MCRALAEAADHCFTTKDLALGTGAAQSMRGWSELASLMDLPEAAVARLDQVHGCRTIRVDGPCTETALPRADASFTQRPGVALAVKVADCVPLLLADRDGRGVAAVHAGWRGTADAVAAVAARALADALGIHPSGLVAAIGPSIGPCCYEVGDEVGTAFAARPHDAGSPERWFSAAAPGRWRLDLWRANVDQLAGAGVDPARIHVAALCTATHVERFCSYRREGAAAGRMAAIIRRKRGS